MPVDEQRSARSGHVGTAERNVADRHTGPAAPAMSLSEYACAWTSPLVVTEASHPYIW
jgi:hypothetical protein